LASDPLTPKPKKRRRWLRWLLALVALFLLLLFFLPNIVALPMFRQRLLDRVAARLDSTATIGGMSLAWLSPVRITDFKLQPDETDRAAISVAKIAGDKLLLQLLMGRGLGSFSIEQPELYVEFDKNGTNISRLLRALSGAAVINRPARLEIVDGRLLLRGKDSPQPWTMVGISLNVTFTPAVESGSGLSELHGGSAQLLHDTELTPDMCNDLFKYVIPLLAETTRTSGRISLEIDQFNWPLGNANAVTLTGHLTLHSVDAAPGPLTKSLIMLVAPGLAASSVEIANNDQVDFQMHDGRVYHENLAFALAGIHVLSHGSVGLDESLDWSVEFQLPALEGLNMAEHPILGTLGQERPTLHFTGTLKKPDWKVEGLSMPALRTLLDLIRRRNENGKPAPQDKSLPDGRPSSGPPR
jgi:hypothetical protein